MASEVVDWLRMQEGAAKQNAIEAEYHGANLTVAVWTGRAAKFAEVATLLSARGEEIERLKALLLPFAQLNERMERDYPGYPDSTSVYFDITHGHLRRAAAALEGSKRDG